LFALASLLPAGAGAQAFLPVADGEERVVRERIAEASREMVSLTCDFKQTKELSILDEKMLSVGRLYYRQANRLRWEYLSPYRYTFILNDKKILMEAETSRNVIDVQSSNLFQEIVRIMMSSINGDGLADIRSFTAAYYRGEGAWRVTLVPVRREIKKIFSLIELTFNTNDYTVDSVRMEEPNGDATFIELSAKQFNTGLADEVFTID
jgi:outer membrane lipoprotein-sorting protein